MVDYPDEVGSSSILPEEVQRTVAPERVLRTAPAELHTRVRGFGANPRHRGGLLVLTDRALTYFLLSPMGLHFPFQVTRGELSGVKAKRGALRLSTTRGLEADVVLEDPEGWARELETWRGA